MSGSIGCGTGDGSAELLAEMGYRVTGVDTWIVSLQTAGERDELQVEWGDVTELEYENAFEKRTDPHGRTYYWMAGTPVQGHNAADSDVAAIEQGMISVTPIHFDLTDYTLMDELRNWNRGNRKSV